MAEKFTDEELSELRRIAAGRTVILNAKITSAEADTEPWIFLGRGDLMVRCTLDRGARALIVGAGYDPTEPPEVTYSDSMVGQ